MDRQTKWNTYLGALDAFVAREGHGRVPASHVERTEDGAVALGSWVAYMRQRKRAGRLTPERENVLSGVPSWEWGPLRPGPSTDRVRNVQILNLRDQGISLQKIGDSFGLSRQRVHQIIRAAS